MRKKTRPHLKQQKQWGDKVSNTLVSMGLFKLSYYCINVKHMINYIKKRLGRAAKHTSEG